MKYVVRLLKRTISFLTSFFRKERKQSSDPSVIQFSFLSEHGVDTQPGNVKLFGLPIIAKHPGSTIRIGRNVILTSKSEVNPAGINHPVILATLSKDAEIIIEDNVGMSGASINCVGRITIKEGTMLGANVNVWDTDFHALLPNDRAAQTSILVAKNAPIVIEKNVWIGANSTILKGATIGENTVVGAMSLVNKDLPPNSICAGVPARKIKDLPIDSQHPSL